MSASTTSNPIATNNKVLIVGAGFAGLTLAQSLRKHSIPFEIFERDENSTARTQGWAVSFHRTLSQLITLAPEGAPPIKTISSRYGLTEPDEGAFYEALTKKCLARGGGRPGGPGPPGSARQPGNTGPNAPPQAGPPLGGHLRANRSRARNWLMTGIDVQWNKRFSSISSSSSDGITVAFEDGTQAHGSILIGADGIQSRVRSALYASHPKTPSLEAVPVGIIVGELTLDTEQFKSQSALARGMWIAGAPSGVKLFACVKSLQFSSLKPQPGEEEPISATYYWMFIFHDPLADKPDFWAFTATPQERLDFAISRTSDFHPDFTEILRLTKVEGMIPCFPIRDILLPSDRLSISAPGVRATIIGDAAHAMAPFKGQGANEAVMDAVELGDAIADEIEKKGRIEPRMLRDFEEKTRERQEQIVRASREAALDKELALPPSGPPPGLGRK